MNDEKPQAIANIQMLMALRQDEEDRLCKIIASDGEAAASKSVARLRLAELQRDDAADRLIKR